MPDFCVDGVRLRVADTATGESIIFAHSLPLSGRMTDARHA